MYAWTSGALAYLRLWSEFAGSNRLVAFGETGDARTLYSTGRDHFFAGPGAAVATSVESAITFGRRADGAIVPEYAAAILSWLAERVRGFRAP